MNNRVLVAGVLLVVVIVLVAFASSKDICSDDVRGYERTASSSLEATRESLQKIRARISLEDNLKLPSQLEGLNATNFAALMACDTQCKLLGRCLRFVFFKSPSEACPTEYVDFRERTNSALKLLEDLKRVETTTKEAEQKARALERARSERSTGEAGLAQLKQELSEKLSTINLEVDQLLSNQIGSAVR